MFDVHLGRVVRNIVISDGIPFGMNMMALDESGTKMFLISKKGITVAQLSQAPLSIATATPQAGSPGAQFKLRGSGFQNGARVFLGTSQANAVYGDAQTLTITVPNMTPGNIRITVSNADGDSYSFDDIFTVQ